MAQQNKPAEKCNDLPFFIQPHGNKEQNLIHRGLPETSVSQKFSPLPSLISLLPCSCRLHNEEIAPKPKI